MYQWQAFTLNYIWRYTRPLKKLFINLTHEEALLVTLSALHPLVVLICPLAIMVYPLEVLGYLLVVHICPFVCSLAVLVIPLVVLAILSVDLFITDNNDGPIKNFREMNFIKNKKLIKNT